MDISRRMPWNLGTLDNSSSLWNIGHVYILPEYHIFLLPRLVGQTQLCPGLLPELTYTCNKEARQAAPKASQQRWV